MNTDQDSKPKPERSRFPVDVEHNGKTYRGNPRVSEPLTREQFRAAVRAAKEADPCP